jgi:hypothetical protein
MCLINMLCPLDDCWLCIYLSSRIREGAFIVLVVSNYFVLVRSFPRS